MSATGNAGPSSTWDADSSKTTTLTVSSASSWLDYLHQVANAVSDQPISSQDPVGSLQPKFSTSVVCQTLAYGIAFALGFVLFGLLLFSARYHWPLSKTNFTMQLAALSIFLLQMALSIAILLEFTRSRSRIWPYMFDYIELALPRDTWNTGQTVAWLFLQGITALSVHSVHLQFLTLLFPSKIEKKLILGMLAPLALLSCFLQFLGIHDDVRVRDLGDSLRAVSNSTLALLYTAALVVWGLAFNRRRAWRNEGGTSAFGGCAIFLGFTGSAVNYVEIKESTILWLQLLIWTILLWQSWISFWWWVSTGMYAGEVADQDKRERRRARRAEKKKARQRRAAGGALASIALDGSVIESTGSRIARRMGLGGLRQRHASSSVADRVDALARQDSTSSTARLSRSEPPPQAGPETVSRRRKPSQHQGGDDAQDIEMDQMGQGTARPAVAESSSDPSDTTAPNIITRFLFQGWTGRLFSRLSVAHHQATRNRAMELPFARSPDGTGPFQVFNAVDEIAQESARAHHTRHRPPRQTYHHQQPTIDRSQEAENSNMPQSSWMWKGRIRQARLKEVDKF